MMHNNRRWSLTEVVSASVLATMLTTRTWTLCSGFFVKGHADYLFLNDATHEDGAGEYAVLKKLPDGRFLQIESITFSWCTEVDALKHIQNALAGEFDTSSFVRPVAPLLDQPGQHRNCNFCA
jgi:hypothetical protein